MHGDLPGADGVPATGVGATAGGIERTSTIQVGATDPVPRQKEPRPRVHATGAFNIDLVEEAYGLVPDQVTRFDSDRRLSACHDRKPNDSRRQEGPYEHGAGTYHCASRHLPRARVRRQWG